MNKSLLSIGAIVIGIIALIVGALYLANVLGPHHVRAYVSLAAGVVLVIAGVAGMVLTRKGSQATS